MPAASRLNDVRFTFRIPHSAIILAFVGLLATARAASGATTLSVAEFLAQEKQWESYARVGSPLKIEGRYSSFSPKLFHLTRCALPFRPKDDAGFPNIRGLSVTIEVEGRLQKRDGKLEFLVDAVRLLPSDEDAFHRKKQEIAAGNSDAWYALGDWAVARGTFYDDKRLISLATEAYQKGCNVEYDGLAKNDVAGRFKLLKKIAQYKLPGQQRQEILHEAYRIDWEARRKQNQRDFSKLIESIGRGLSGALEVPKTPQPKLEKRYHDAPMAVFRDSDQETRKRLNRIFYVDVVLASIEIDARPDGRNGFAIAARIDERLPEMHDLAETYRGRELEFKLTQIAGYTQQQVVELSKQFADRGLPKKARETRAAWLTAKAKPVQSKDTEGMLFLAEQYEALLGDKETAVALLLKAYAERPESPDVAAALARQGYTLKDGKWLTVRAVKNLPVDPTDQAIREGRVTKGMTTEQVQKALGRPTSITRIATAAEVSEVWIYREQSVNRVMVHFSSRPGTNGRATVVATF